MSLRLFRNFPQAWDKYEQQIRIEFLKRFQTNTQVPTFDSGDREWDSKVLESLF